VLRLFPDPQFWNRASFAIMGEQGGTVTSYYSLTLSAFSKMTVGQYDEAIADIEEALAIQDEQPEAYLFQGLAYCSKGDYAKAQIAYTEGLELDDDFTVLYLLRAETYSRQGSTSFAFADLTSARGTSSWPKFEAFLAEHPEMITLGCESFFSR